MKRFYFKRLLKCAILFMVCVIVGCKEGYGDRNHRGLFSVSATCQVEFATGNLSENGRSFVEHQWESGGLFGWGTGDRPTDTTDKWEDYVRFVDWGNFVAGGWRTLTADEWHHLLFERSGADEKNAVGSVNGMHGLLLLPDECALPSGILFDCKAIDWNANSYSVDQWEQLEDAGVIFLPAAGFRWGEVSYSDGCQGLYWSSTTKEEGCPYTMHFDGSILSVDWDNTPHFGQSVRLVRDCK